MERRRSFTSAYLIFKSLKLRHSDESRNPVTLGIVKSRLRSVHALPLIVNTTAWAENDLMVYLVGWGCNPTL